MDHRGKTVTKPLPLSRLGLPLSEKQIPQVVENLESGGKSIEALERVAMRPRQVRYPFREHLLGVQEVPRFYSLQTKSTPKVAARSFLGVGAVRTTENFSRPR